MDENRYMGREDLTDIEQVALYIRDNYVDGNGDDLTMAVAKAICQYEEMWEWIQNGVANRSFVYYIGDMIAERAKLNERDEEDDLDRPYPE